MKRANAKLKEILIYCHHWKHFIGEPRHLLLPGLQIPVYLYDQFLLCSIKKAFKASSTQKERFNAVCHGSKSTTGQGCLLFVTTGVKANI